MLLAALAFTATLGCRSEGVVSLSFSIGGELPDDLTGLYFHTQVRDPSGAVLGGAVREASVDAPIQLSIAHGEGRVARLEVRDGASAETSAVIAYGVSEPFDLIVGRSIRVNVAIPLRRVPRITALSVANVSGGAVASSQLTLRIEADRAQVVEAVVAQDPSLSFRRARVALQPDARVHEVPYDLELDCENTGGCADGTRAVFVRLIDDAGYTSSSTSTTIVLDTTPPAVLGGSASVAFEAPGAIVVPTAAGVGTTVRLTFTFNETVTSTPTVRLAGSELPFDYVTTEFGAWIFERTVGDDPPGVQRPLVTGRDAAGNASPFASPSLEYEVDDVPPSAPDVDDAERIVYERAPWGTFDDPAPRYVVRGSAGTVEPGTRVVVYDAARALVDGVERANRAGVAVALADGSFEVALAPFDRGEVYVLLVDPSGNLHDANGTAARVRNTVLTVPAAVEGAGPPTEVYAMERLPRSLRRDFAGVTPVGDGTGLALEDGVGPVVDHPLRWTEIAAARTPLPDEVRFAGTAYDAARARTVLLGGRFGDEVRNETWEFDGRTWTTFVTSGAAPRCQDGSLDGEEAFGHFAFHGRYGRSVLVCRRLVPDQPPPLGPGSVDRLVAYGWSGERWGEIGVAPGAEPPSRNGHAVAYDEAVGALVVFGGNESSLAAAGQFGTGLADTWTLEVSASTTTPTLRWVDRTEANAPPARDRHAMVYAPGLGVVMFGGITSARGRAALDDLWLWDGAAWSEVPRTTPWPSARACHTMVYDPESGAVGVLGGVTSEPNQRCLAEPGLDDAWWWDGTGWTQTATQAGTPSGSGIVAATHGALDDVIVVSGAALGAAAAPSKTWRVSEQGWFDRTPSDARLTTAFEPGNGASATYHAGLDAVLVHTSYVPPANVGETWTWDDGGWRLLSVEPTIGQPSAMVYDPVRGEAVMFAKIAESLVGLFLHDGRAWRYVEDPDPGPAGIAGNILAFDTSRQEVVAFAFETFTASGGVGGALWSWNGVRWQLIWSGDEPTGESTLLYEPTPNRFLTTTYVGLDGFWNVFQSGVWTQQPLFVPWTAWGAGFRDPLRDKTYRAGFDGVEADLYELRAFVFEPRATVGAKPTGFAALEPAYDPRRKRIVAPIANPSQVGAGNLRVLDVDPDNRPAVTVRFDLARAAVRGTVVGVTVEAAAGGRAFEAVGGATVEGVASRVWDHQRGAWRSLGGDAATTDAPARFEASASGSDAAALVRSLEPSLDVAITPNASLGAGHSPSVRLDRLAVRIAYRSP